MSYRTMPSVEELRRLDQFYREGGLRAMASPHVHYDEPRCPHAGCSHEMEWIDFKLELFHDPEGVYLPLVRSWWEGAGFVGRCPQCLGWVHFTTLGMKAVGGPEAERLPRLPDDWHKVAQIG